MKKDLILNNTKENFDYNYDKSGDVVITIDSETFKFKKSRNGSGALIWNTEKGSVKTWSHGGDVSVAHRDLSIIDPKNQKRVKGANTESGGMTSPMPGKILKVLVKVGDQVKSGDPLIVMEAMKMEHTIKASESGILSSLDCSEGRLVDGGVSLCSIESESKDI
jgi:biotin carboxyl carrier protein